jgi:sugar lactone lactonase YvrE
MSWRLLLLCCLLSPLARAQDLTALEQQVRLALGALEGGEPKAALALLRTAEEYAPSDVGVQLLLAQTLVRLDRKEEALMPLERVMAADPSFDPRADPALAPLEALPAYQALLTRMAQAARPATGRVRTAFKLPLRDLLPEGITYDPRTGRKFLSSIRKGGVLAVDTRGRHHWFVPPRQKSHDGQKDSMGLASPLGLKVDAVRRLLWVASHVSKSLEGAASAKAGTEGVFVYDLDRGTLRRKIVPDTPGPHLFNDLALAGDGTAFVTDSAAGMVYRIPAERDVLEPLVRAGQPSRLVYPNGIVLSEDQRTLYVAAEIMGLYRLGRDSGELTPVLAAPGVHLLGIDGLARDGQTLVAVQNGLRPGRVARFRLSDDGARVTACEVLAARHPGLRLPTTGVIINREFWFIANSQLDRRDADGNLPPHAMLAEPVVLRVPLP